MSKILLFNKPYSVLCQFRDNSGRQTLESFIPIPDVYPAGRLDADSEGLLLLTDDGKLQHRISHPKHKLEKTYWAQVEGIPDLAALEALRAGPVLNDGPTRACHAQLLDEPALWPRTPPVRYRAKIPTAWLQIKLTEGRNRQVRRMTAAVGYPTLRLIRVAIGDWQLQGIMPGEYRVLHLEHNR